MYTRAITIALLCLSTQAFADIDARLYGYWPVGGGKITVAPIDDPVALGGIEFAAEPGILTQGTSPAPFPFFIPNSESRQGYVTLGSLTAISIGGPVELDITVSAEAVRGDISGFTGRPPNHPPQPPVPGTFSLGPCGEGEDCLALICPIAVECDLNEDGECNAMDIDFLSSAIRAGEDATKFDLNLDGVVTGEDRVFWIESIRGTLAGDADLNGVVQFADFLALSDNFGDEGGWAQGDFDGDGLVEFPDFLVLSKNFGKSPSGAASLASVSSVPEPSSFGSTLFGILACTAILRHRRGR